MAFPTIAATNTSTELSDVTSHTISLPSGIVAGDLLLIFFTMSNQAFPTVGPADFALISPPGVLNHGSGEARLRIYWKRATGSEGSTSSLTTNTGSQSAHATYRITGGGEPVGVAGAEGASSTPDPPALTPAGGSDDYLWLASCAIGEGAATVTGAPASYTNLLAADTGGGAGDVALGTARRALTGTTDNPGTFTSSASVDWVASTIAVPVLTTRTATIDAFIQEPAGPIPTVPANVATGIITLTSIGLTWTDPNTPDVQIRAYWRVTGDAEWLLDGTLEAGTVAYTFGSGTPLERATSYDIGVSAWDDTIEPLESAIAWVSATTTGGVLLTLTAFIESPGPPGVQAVGVNFQARIIPASQVDPLAKRRSGLHINK